MNEISGLVVIGSSTGGLAALTELLKSIRLSRCAVVIVQHMPEFINESLRASIQQNSGMPCCLPLHGEKIKVGTVYLARYGTHLEIEGHFQTRMILNDPVNFVCPAVDVTMRSLVATTGIPLMGVVLTGMGKDGAAGIRHMKSIGAFTVVQTPQTCVVAGMVAAAIATGSVDAVMDLAMIRQELITRFG